ncbi:MAG: bifunctional methylenetetrahydrofolate dehydrogenase/methenyltetrahydrofolate cyclohydrolase FolD [Amaricoccus sp.]|uniref:bifunctional 5,10-methylenetetrahydrofolate dehydrogenase/5,10-methenyltetrahydrofolate cyclohydrolase n=1 Tax=Amaricoccus sp. TaxID=1872485 RepID=UPI0039E32CD7
MSGIIDGRAAAAAVIDEVRAGTKALGALGTVPGLAVVLVGSDPASQTYVAAKGRMARECGFRSRQIDLPATVSQAELTSVIEALNADAAVHGILVQLPLPAPLDAAPILKAIRPEKDVDGLHPVNAGALASGDLDGGLLPCTPAGAMRLVRAVHGGDLSGLVAVVVGRSNLFGKPMGQLLLAANATVVMAHSRTRDLPGICRLADILVVAVGRAEMVRADWVKPGATVIDVGINRLPPEAGAVRGRLTGDVDFAGVRGQAGRITPVPGGVGPMTIAMLMANTLTAAQRAAAEAAAPAAEFTDRL